MQTLSSFLSHVSIHTRDIDTVLCPSVCQTLVLCLNECTLYFYRLTAIQENDLYDMMVSDRKVAERQNYGDKRNSSVAIFVIFS